MILLLLPLLLDIDSQVLKVIEELEDVSMLKAMSTPQTPADVLTFRQQQQAVRLRLLGEERAALQKQLQQTHSMLAQAMSERDEAKERGNKLLANIIAQQQGLVTRAKLARFIQKLGVKVTDAELDQFFVRL